MNWNWTGLDWTGADSTEWTGLHVSGSGVD